MRTARSLPWQRPLPLDRDLPDRDPLDRDPHPVNRITDRCKNITFPQIRLRAVMKHICLKISIGQYSMRK